MQKIERYGVIALVFLLVTILAVSLWGEGKGSGLFFWKKDGVQDDKLAQADQRPRPRANANAQQQGGQAANQGARGPLGGAARSLGGGPEISQPNLDPVEVRARQERLEQMRREAERQKLLADAQNAPAGPAPAVVPGPSNFGSLPTPDVEGAAPTQSPAVVRPAPTPGSAPSRSYQVRAGDTLGEIARRELGSTSRWTEIQALNGNLDPKRVREGMKLVLPAGGAAQPAVTAGVPTSAPASNGARTYTIRSGDTLSSIAAVELGSAERWNEIAGLNPRVDPKRLAVGQVLVLPSGGSRVAATPRAPAVDERRSVAYGTPPAGKSKVQ